MKPRTKREKIRRAEAWVRENFDTPFRVTVQISRRVGDEFWGDCWRQGRRIIIRINAAAPANTAVETLFHEWAHAVTMKHARLEERRYNLGMEHDDEFWLVFGRIYRGWFDEGGREDAYL